MATKTPRPRAALDLAEVEAAREQLEANFRQSSFRESLLEHAFISEVLQEAWFSRGEVVEVLRAEVDAFGYDVVFQLGSTTRHIQLKASHATARTSRQTVHTRLMAKPAGCVIWLVFDESDRRVRMVYLFREALNEKGLSNLGDRVGKRAGTTKQRPDTRVLTKRDFDVVPTASELLARLFPT